MLRTHVSPEPHAEFLAPPMQWSDADSAAHVVQFYEDDAFLLDGVSRFVGSYLRTGQAALVIATEGHRRALAVRLEAEGVDVANATSQGQFISLDAAETLAICMSEGWPDAARFTAHVGGLIARSNDVARGTQPRVGIFGEMVALLCADGKAEAAIRLEHCWNGLGQTHAFSLRCAYPLTSFRRLDDSETLARICATHTWVIPAESYTSLEDDEGRFRAITLLQQKAQALEAERAENDRVQRSLRHQEAELTAMVAGRDSFLSIAAHELKTPVTSLRAYAQLLLRDARRTGVIASERLEAGLAAIERQTDKLDQLVWRLLVAAQLDARTLRIELTATDLVALVGSVIARQRDWPCHTWVFARPERLEAMVDPMRFAQVITHVVDNARRFSPEGGIVTVELGRDDHDGIRLSITDQGVGIPFDEREAVFDRFHHAHGASHVSGMGLGLFITRAIMTLHGGFVRIEEPAQRGARVVLTLPASAGDQTGSSA